MKAPYNCVFISDNKCKALLFIAHSWEQRDTLLWTPVSAGTSRTCAAVAPSRCGTLHSAKAPVDGVSAATQSRNFFWSFSNKVFLKIKSLKKKKSREMTTRTSLTPVRQHQGTVVQMAEKVIRIIKAYFSLYIWIKVMKTQSKVIRKLAIKEK